MAYSKITLEFIGIPPVDHVFGFLEDTLGITFTETFKTNRYGSFQSELPVYDAVNDNFMGFISSGYRSALDMDYNATGLFNISKSYGAVGSGLGTVVVEANYSGAVFHEISDEYVNVNIENEVMAPDFTIDAVTFTPKIGEESSRCNVNIATNHLATKLLQPFITDPNTDNPIIFAAYRAMTFTVEVVDVNSLRSIQTVTTPAYLNINNFTLNVVNSPSGGTLNVSNVNSDGLVLQYSLDNSTWQTSPVFPGLPVGLYNLYIKDQLGYFVTSGFSVVDTGIYIPYFYISKSNSFRFANRITWGDSANYKTDENTLSREVVANVVHEDVQRFQSANVITTQFKSNYTTNTAKVVKSDLSEVNVPVVKKTSNIGIQDKRDAFMYDLGNGKTGLYFISGNIYDYVTGLASGTHFMNGLLPEWKETGNYVQIGSAWFLIEGEFYDETKNADVLVISNTYTGPEVSVIVASIFNRFNYEVYEFTIDMVDYIDQVIMVRINNTDPNFTPLIHLTEKIWCKIKHEKVLEIKYSNSTNTDIFYATGIENTIYIPYTFIKGKVDEDSEVHKTDTNSILLNADVYEVDEIVFEPVTKEIWRKLVLALSHENVTINGVGYVKNGNFNTEGPLEESNLYVLTATMIKTGSVYTSQSSGNMDFDGTAVAVPGLIQTDTGFVSY